MTAEDQAAADAAAKAAVTYLNETTGHRLTRAQQQMADKAARLARALVRVDEQKRGRR
jgi:hypothetical protein